MGSPSAIGPGACGGCGLGGPTWRTAISNGIRQWTLSAIPAQTAIHSLPPGRSAPPRLRNAARWSAKNMTPKREVSRSKLAGEQRGQIGDPLLGDPPAQQAEHRLGDVDTGDMATGPDRGGERQRRRAGAAADIENALAGGRLRLAQQDLRDLDVARFLDFSALDPARSGDLVPVTLHRGVGGARSGG